jgi:hypothetical protein
VVRRSRVAQYAFVQAVVMLTIGSILYVLSQVRYLPSYNDLVLVNYVNWPLYVWGQVLMILGAITIALSGGSLLGRKAYLWIIRTRSWQPQQ